ncbi:DUF4279 domain-containing protein [Knoellia sp. S7-12]|uniref:DUF4279 domain-containing protein n=1 Tax=Knoellia sp. S7-12 TaxID=3126698 RepID=UPI00336857C8
MTSTSRVQQRAELVAYAANEDDDFDPVALTEFLGIDPTSVHRKGELLKGGRVRPFSAWMWSTADQVEVDTEVLIREVLDNFEPMAKVDEARGRFGLEFKMDVVIEMYGHLDIEPDGTTGAVVATPALYLSPGTLLRLTRLGCGLDIDTYVIAPE